MKKLIVTLLIAFLVSVACSQKTTDVQTDNDLKIDCFLTDSLGIERNIFHINDDIWLNFSIKNISGNDIEYHKVSYIDDLIDFSVSPSAEFAELDIEFLPPQEFLILHIQKPDEIIESINKLPVFEIGSYSISICPFVMYNRDEFNLSSRFRIDFQIIEEKKK